MFFPKDYLIPKETTYQGTSSPYGSRRQTNNNKLPERLPKRGYSKSGSLTGCVSWTSMYLTSPCLHVLCNNFSFLKGFGMQLYGAHGTFKGIFLAFVFCTVQGSCYLEAIFINSNIVVCALLRNREILD